MMDKTKNFRRIQHPKSCRTCEHFVLTTANPAYTDFGMMFSTWRCDLMPERNFNVDDYEPDQFICDNWDGDSD